jgi:hypothetical protein
MAVELKSLKEVEAELAADGKPWAAMQVSMARQELESLRVKVEDLGRKLGIRRGDA